VIAQHILNELIPPLNPADTVAYALKWMDEFRVNQLAVVSQQKFLGLVSSEVLYDSESGNQTLANVPLLHTDAWVYSNQHFYDVIQKAHLLNVELISVLDENGLYMGTITIKDTINALARSCATNTPGSIMVLSMDYRDYTLTKIAQLVEEENARILSSFVETDAYDPNKIKITLKINRTDLRRIGASLERFGFKIIAQFNEDMAMGNEKSRLDLLFKFLDI